MKKFLLALLLTVSISGQAKAWWCDDMVSGVLFGSIDTNLGGGFYNDCLIGESWMLSQQVKGTYEKTAGVTVVPIIMSMLGVGYDFNTLISDSAEYLHPYVRGLFDITFLIIDDPNDFDNNGGLGIGYTLAAGANYRFDRFVLGAEFNQVYAAFTGNNPSNHSQNYMLTLGLSFY